MTEVTKTVKVLFHVKTEKPRVKRLICRKKIKILKGLRIIHNFNETLCLYVIERDHLFIFPDLDKDITVLNCCNLFSI